MSTEVALVVSKPTDVKTSDPYYSQRVQVVLWALSHGKQWTYYTYWDHPRQGFGHSNALLQRLAPIGCIHVGVGDGLNATNPGTGGRADSGATNATARATQQKSNQAVVEKLLQFLDEHKTEYATRLDRESTEDGKDEILVKYHPSYKVSTDAMQRLSTILPDLLRHSSLVTTDAASSSETETVGAPPPLAEQVLRVAADSQLQSSTSPVRKAFVFALQATGLWDAPTHDAQGYTLERGIVESHLFLDRTAADAIHLWPPSGIGEKIQVGGQPHNNSLAGILLQPCHTIMASRLLESWLRQPLVDLISIQKRHDAVGWLVQHSVARDAIRSEGLRLFKGQDIGKLAAILLSYKQALDHDDEDGGSGDKNTQTTGGMVEPVGSTRKALQAIYDLYVISAQKLPILLEQLETALQESAPSPSSILIEHVLEPLRSSMLALEKSVALATAVLDMDAAPREFLVQASFREELADLRQELLTVQDEIQACHDEMNDQWSQITGNQQQVRMEQSDAEWQFRLPNTNDSKLLQQNFGGDVKIHRILKNGVYFSTNELRQLASKQQDLRADYDRYQRQVALDAVKVAATYQPVLEQVGDALALLDVVCALAHVAAHHGYCRPTMTDSDADGCGIALEQARHPCVERQENIEYIPNDIRLIFGQSSFLIVTGPNMGGKSTYIRAVGGIVTLAQIGSFVPCKSATINICHHILARVGAGDLQERGISTFMAEMLESSSILRTATRRSLIIVDELGRGTSTFDGYGLARAISEYIVHNIGCLTVFATHFHELTAMEEKETVVRNCHVTAMKAAQGLTFLYEVRPGPCLESFGIQVAEMANVPATVIEDAKRKAVELENFEYHSKKSRMVDVVEGIDDAGGESAEETAASLAWLSKFKRLPESLLSLENNSFVCHEERRDAILRQLEAA